MSGYKEQNAVNLYIKERRHFGWERRGIRTVKFAKIKKGETVLDLCSGPGMVTKVIRKQVGPTGKVVGIDYSEDFIKYAKKFCKYKNVTFIKGDIENLNKYCGSQKFDVITLLASWPWIKDKPAVFDQIKSRLNNDGRFLFNIHGDDFDDKMTREFFWIYRENIKNEITRIVPGYICSHIDNQIVVDQKYINKVIRDFTRIGFKSLGVYEAKRYLTISDKLYVYRNPARTEWVGNFSPTVRFNILKNALLAALKKMKVKSLKRRTYYLLFGI